MDSVWSEEGEVGKGGQSGFADRSALPEILEPCLEGLFADHVIGLRFALVRRYRDQRPRSHVVKCLIGYGEPLRQVRP